MDKRKWVFALRVHDRAGTVTSVSSVFTNRGVSLQMLLGSTIQVVIPDSIPLYFVFEAAERRKNTLLRAMRRLDSVIWAECYEYDSPSLRAVAFAHVDGRVMDDAGVAAIASETEVISSPIVSDDGHKTWVLLAEPIALERCLERLGDTGALLHVTATVMPIAPRHGLRIPKQKPQDTRP